MFVAGMGMARQPAASNSLLKTMLIGQAISETPGIFALVVALMLTFRDFSPGTLAQAMALIGAGISVGVGAIGAGVGTGITSGDACEAAARRPDASQDVTVTMLLGQAIGTTPAVFGFFIANVIRSYYFPKAENHHGSFTRRTQYIPQVGEFRNNLS